MHKLQPSFPSHTPGHTEQLIFCKSLYLPQAPSSQHLLMQKPPVPSGDQITQSKVAHSQGTGSEVFVQIPDPVVPSQICPYIHLLEPKSAVPECEPLD